VNQNKEYIKFRYEWDNQGFFFPEKTFETINYWRNKLYEKNLIGAIDKFIGFGNISLRIDKTNQFIISGSATGLYKNLNKLSYAKVTDFNIDNNFIRCVGGTKASSESLTHAAIYQNNQSINGIVHTHHKGLWKALFNKKPTTSEEALFGTTELAREIEKLMKKHKTLKEKTIILGGHKEGILTIGETLEEAVNTLLNEFNQLEN
jgi:ribulose-5-phosphate 4-epimerase/fuculose-1-phosphate aldolase